jgi:hypothetical protein
LADQFPPDTSDPPFALPPARRSKAGKRLIKAAEEAVAIARRGGRSPKRKGSGFEREIVTLLQELGLAAERVPLSGAVKTSRFDHDIFCPIRGVDRRIEAKRRARAFMTIDAMLGSNFALVVRDDRSRPLVVMTLTAFAELAK